MRYLIIVLAACGGTAAVPAQSAPKHAHWETVAGALYGVALNDGGFEVSIVDDNDEDGKPMPMELDAYDNGKTELKLPLVSETAAGFEFAGAGKRVTVTKDKQRTTFAPAPELAEEDRVFDRDTAKDGVDGWTKHFASDGALWRRTGRVEGHEKIAEAIGKTLAAGSLRWVPVAHGKRGELGFTLGTWTLTKADGVARGSYCTIWKRDGDRWFVLFDIGRTTR